MDGLLQGALQVDGPLLYHFADVLYPVLLVFYTGSLNEVGGSIRAQKGPFPGPALTTLRPPPFLELPILKIPFWQKSDHILCLIFHQIMTLVLNFFIKTVLVL